MSLLGNSGRDEFGMRDFRNEGHAGVGGVSEQEGGTTPKASLSLSDFSGNPTFKV